MPVPPPLFPVRQVRSRKEGESNRLVGFISLLINILSYDVSVNISVSKFWLCLRKRMESKYVIVHEMSVA